MEINQNQNEFTIFALKVVVIVIAAAGFTIGIFFAFNSFNGNNNVNAVKLENLPFYDSTTNAIVLSNNTAALSGLQNCDIYVSGPNKQIKYFQTVNCDKLSSTEISKQTLLSLFNNQQGIYTITIFAQNISRGTNVSFEINSGG